MAEEFDSNSTAPQEPFQSLDAADLNPESAGSPSPSLRRALAGKWQIPLLAVGLLLLLSGVPAVFTPPAAPPPDPLPLVKLAYQHNDLTQTVALADALLAQETDPARQSRLLLLRGLAVGRLAEAVRGADRRTNARQSAENLSAALKLAGSPDNLDGELVTPAGFYGRRAQAHLWTDATGSLERGEADLQTAFDRLAPGEDALRKRLILLAWNVNPPLVHRELEKMIAADGAAGDAVWAIRKKARLLTELSRPDDAIALLEEKADALPRGSGLDALEIELARVHYDAATDVLNPPTPARRQAHLDKAHLLLSAIQLRRTAAPGEEELDSEFNWLLGEVNFTLSRPVEAEQAFDHVVRHYPNTRYGRAAYLGVAKSAALYERFDRAHEAYAYVVSQLADAADDPLINRRAVQQSLLALAEQLSRQERWESAYRFATLLYQMLDETQSKPSQADVREKQGVLLRKLAAEEIARAEQLRAEVKSGHGDKVEADEAAALTASAKRHLCAAAEAFLDAARKVAVDEKRSGDDLEMAAHCYDEAGELLRAIRVLRKFINEYPANQPRVARAIFDLAKAYQAAGLYPDAIACYRRMVEEYPKSPDANKSLVPMAQCHKSLQQFAEAETLLLSVLENDEVFSPDSAEYADALFELAKLNYDRSQYREAIARFDEFLQREPQHRQSLFSRYCLADSYRLSGLQLDESIASARTPLERDQLAETRRQWLRRSREIFDQVIGQVETGAEPETKLDELTWHYLRNSYFFRADCMFDLGQYDEAIWLYDLAALKYHGQPEAVAAYVQIVNCYLRMGKPDQARTANERAKWLLKKLPAEEFARRPLPLDKDYFARWLEWMGQSGTW